MDAKDFQKLSDDLNAALVTVDQTQVVVDGKRGVQNKALAQLQAAVDQAAREVSAATADHQQAVDAANAVRRQLETGLAEKLGPDGSGRVR